MKSPLTKAKAFAPATVANVAVGYDILGFAIEGLGESATIERRDDGKIVIDPIVGFPEIPLEPHNNTATAGLLRMQKDLQLPFGFHVRLSKQIPTGSGLGGSSTSAVAALFAANQLLKRKLPYPALFDYALTGEAVASGVRHGDNVGPCLYGGLLLIQGGGQPRVAKINSPNQLRCVILLPKLSVKTKEARALLRKHISLTDFVEQTANLAGFILGCEQSDFTLIGESLRDSVIEPQRAHLIPGFTEIKKSALLAGALGCSISGSGPAIFALTKGEASAKKIELAMRREAKRIKMDLIGSWIAKISKQGARLLK